MGGVAWSADSRWLLLTDGTEPRQKWYVRLDTRTGEERRSDPRLGFAEGALPSPARSSTRPIRTRARPVRHRC